MNYHENTGKQLTAHSLEGIYAEIMMLNQNISNTATSSPLTLQSQNRTEKIEASRRVQQARDDQQQAIQKKKAAQEDEQRAQERVYKAQAEEVTA